MTAEEYADSVDPSLQSSMDVLTETADVSPDAVSPEPTAIVEPSATAEPSAAPEQTQTASPPPAPDVVEPPRTLAWKNFEKALKEITPSASEYLGSLAELRKWNDEFGEGRKERRKQVWGKGRFGFVIPAESKEGEKESAGVPPPQVQQGKAEAEDPPV